VKAGGCSDATLRARLLVSSGQDFDSFKLLCTRTYQARHYGQHRPPLQSPLQRSPVARCCRKYHSSKPAFPHFSSLVLDEYTGHQRLLGTTTSTRHWCFPPYLCQNFCCRFSCRTTRTNALWTLSACCKMLRKEMENSGIDATTIHEDIQSVENYAKVLPASLQKTLPSEEA
jgi:hypothetical protein